MAGAVGPGEEDVAIPEEGVGCVVAAAEDMIEQELSDTRCYGAARGRAREGRPGAFCPRPVARGKGFPS